MKYLVYILIACSLILPFHIAAEVPPNAQNIVDAFAKSGLPVTKVKIFDAKSDPNKLLGRPRGYTSKVSFHDKRYLDDINEELYQHTVEVFANSTDAANRKAYIDKVTKGVAFLQQYQFLRGRVLLRLDRALTPDEAEEYKIALRKLPL